MHYTDGIEFMKACIVIQRTERMTSEMSGLWDSYMYGEFYAALKKIADMGPEENEWDAVDKYDEAKKIASDVLAKYAARPPQINGPG